MIVNNFTYDRQVLIFFPFRSVVTDIVVDAETTWTFLQLHYTALTDSDARWPLANSDIDVAISPASSGCCANKCPQYPETESLFVNRKADGDLGACGTFFVEMACIVELRRRER